MSLLNSVWYVDSVSYAAIGAWVQGTVTVAGTLIKQTAPAVGSERVFICIIAGITRTTGAGGEPAWTTTKGAKTADATVTWQECTGQPGVCGDLTNCKKSSDARSQTPTLGTIIQNNSGAQLFICSTFGSCLATEPTFNVVAGQMTTDGGCTWTCIGNVGSFTAFQCAFSRLAASLTANRAAPGDTVYVGDDHAETQAVAMTITPPAGLAKTTNILCADHTKHPPTSSDLKTTAAVTTTGASALSINGGSAYFYGITFQASSGANNALLTLQPVGYHVYDSCSLQKLGTASGSGTGIVLGATNQNGYVRLKNTTVKFGNVGDGIVTNTGSRVVWEDTPSAIAGATIPSSLFIGNTCGPQDVLLRGVDISALGSNALLGGGTGTLKVTLLNCKLGTSYAFGTPLIGQIVDSINSDSAASNLNYLVSRNLSTGSNTTATNPVRTGGASDGTTAVSWNIQTTANCSWTGPFSSMPISTWNGTTGTNRVVSIYGISNAAAVPNNDDIWFDVSYLGSSASPMATLATTTKSNLLASNAAYSADTSAWDSAATARANSQAYNVGDIIKVATNPGRVFFCTSAGTSNGSEPGGYASAVDGGVVTDSGATFRAGCRFVMSVTLSGAQPARAGYMRVTIQAALLSTTTWWIDPLIVLS